MVYAHTTPGTAKTSVINYMMSYKNTVAFLTFVVIMFVIDYLMYQNRMIKEGDEIMKKQYDAIIKQQEAIQIQREYINLLEGKGFNNIENSPIHLYNKEL